MREPSKQVEIEVIVKQQTDDAYLIFDGRTNVWIAKSQVTDQCEESDGTITSIFIPEWLAKEKGLI